MDLVLGHLEPEIIHTLEIDLIVDHFLQRGWIDVGASPNCGELGQRLLGEREVLTLLLRPDELGEILVLQGLLVEVDRSRFPVVLAGDAHRSNRGQRLVRLDDVLVEEPPGEDDQREETRRGHAPADHALPARLDFPPWHPPLRRRRPHRNWPAAYLWLAPAPGRCGP